jgi:hypothetical protein
MDNLNPDDERNKSNIEQSKQKSDKGSTGKDQEPKASLKDGRNSI